MIYLSFDEYSKHLSAKKFLQSKAKEQVKTKFTQEEQVEIRQDIFLLSKERFEEMRTNCARIVHDGLALCSSLSTQTSAKTKGKMKTIEKEHTDVDLVIRPSALYTQSLQTFDELLRSFDAAARTYTVPSWSKAFPQPPSNLVRCAEALATAVFPMETITVDRVISMGCTFVCNRCPKAFNSGPMGWKDIVGCSPYMLIIWYFD